MIHAFTTNRGERKRKVIRRAVSLASAQPAPYRTMAGGEQPETASAPLVPARGAPRRTRRGDPVAGTQILDSRLRGNERTATVVPPRAHRRQRACCSVSLKSARDVTPWRSGRD